MTPKNVLETIPRDAIEFVELRVTDVGGLLTVRAKDLPSRAWRGLQCLQCLQCAQCVQCGRSSKVRDMRAARGSSSDFPTRTALLRA